MADEVAILDEQSIELVDAVVRKVLGERGNTPFRNDVEHGRAEDQQADDLFIACPARDSGIDGMNHRERGVAQDGDVLGSGECDIFKVTAGRLEMVEHLSLVYNCSEERLRNDFFPVTRTKHGDWIVVNKTVILSVLLLKKLDPATGPLTGATVGEALVLEWSEKATENLGVYTPAKWAASNRLVRFVNRSKSIRGEPGTFGKIQKEQGEFNPLVFDCTSSEEGTQIIIETLRLVGSGIGAGVHGGHGVTVI